MGRGGRFRSGLLRDWLRQEKSTLGAAASELWVQLRSLIGGISRQAGILTKSSIVIIYFYFWSWKAEIRQNLRFSSLAILIASAMMPIMEAVFDFTGKQWVAAAVAAFGHDPYWQSLFILALLYIARHNQNELKKPEHEYVFVTRLREILRRDSQAGQGSLQTALEMLEKCHAAFKAQGISHVFISSVADDGLIVERDHIYPQDGWSAYYLGLRFKRKQGVAGWVWEDDNIRYVPRFYWPVARAHVHFSFCVTSIHLLTMPFPHAVKYSFANAADHGEPKRPTRLTEEEPHFGCVEYLRFSRDVCPAPGGVPEMNLPFRAFLSVPLRTKEGTLGVLNFHFDRVDPLGKPEIEMALLFGLAIAGELFYNQRVTK